MMTMEEMNQEVLECARYGEHEDLRTLLVHKADVNHTDEAGTTALHKAAANGEIECLKVLKEFGVSHVANDQGNLPIHWAALNGKTDALKYLLENFEVDVLAKNKLGVSTLTEAFNSKNNDVIALCLEHKSSTEEKLMDMKNDSGSKVNEENHTKPRAESESEVENGDLNAVEHLMALGEESKVKLKIRELPITRADNPFGTDTAPEDDTTGLAIWPASIILARWVAKLAGTEEDSKETSKDDSQASSSGRCFDGKVVVELGAGCALPSIAAALYGQPKIVYATDIHVPTIKNAEFNVKLNSSDPDSTNGFLYKKKNNSTDSIEQEETKVVVQTINWSDFDTFPEQKADVLLGSDLVYDNSILHILVPAIDRLLTPGGVFLYVAPTDGRAGLNELELKMAEAGFQCVMKIPVPEEFYANPLSDEDEKTDLMDLFILHFYNLSIKQPHFLYQFRRKEALGELPNFEKNENVMPPKP